MFCGNCGKEIIGNTRFCPYCGAEQTATVIQAAAAAPVYEAAGEVPVNTVAAENAPTSHAAAVPAIAAAPGIPTPNVIPTNNLGVPEPTAAAEPRTAPSAVTSAAPSAAASSEPQGVTSVAVVIEKEEDKPRPERKYSLKHIVMCLAAAAVMAVAAGVFAGLYFSVI